MRRGNVLGAIVAAGVAIAPSIKKVVADVPSNPEDYCAKFLSLTQQEASPSLCSKDGAIVLDLSLRNDPQASYNRTTAEIDATLEQPSENSAIRSRLSMESSSEISPSVGAEGNVIYSRLLTFVPFRVDLDGGSFESANQVHHVTLYCDASGPALSAWIPATTASGTRQGSDPLSASVNVPESQLSPRWCP